MYPEQLISELTQALARMLRDAARRCESERIDVEQFNVWIDVYAGNFPPHNASHLYQYNLPGGLIAVPVVGAGVREKPDGVFMCIDVQIGWDDEREIGGYAYDIALAAVRQLYDSAFVYLHNKHKRPELQIIKTPGGRA